MKKFIFYILFFLFLIPILIGQDMGMVQFQLYPSNAVLKIDDEIQSWKNQSIRLEEGDHIIQIWAPTFDVFTDTISVKADSKQSYSKGLKIISEDYRSYKKKNGKYVGRKILFYAIDATFLATATINTVALKNLLARDPILETNKNLAIQAAIDFSLATGRAEYNDALERYEIASEVYERYRIEHNDRIKKGLPVIIGVYSICSVYCIMRFIRPRLKKPIYESQNPLVSQLLKLDPNLTYQNETFQIGATIKF